MMNNDQFMSEFYQQQVSKSNTKSIDLIKQFKGAILQFYTQQEPGSDRIKLMLSELLEVN